MIDDGETLIHGGLVLIGLFYVFAGALGIKVSLQSRLYDVVIAAIGSGTPSRSETARGVWLLVAALLVLASGLLLVLRHEWAAWAFVASAAGQAIYLLFVAPVLLDPGDPPDAQGRQQTTNAFLLYSAVTAFVLWAYQTGRLIPSAQAWSPALAIAGLLLTAAALYGGWKFIAPFGRATTADPSPAAQSGADDDASEWADPDAPDRPLHTSQRIVLMADYHCDPLWAHDPDLNGTIPTAALGLSPGLVDDLTAWSDAYTQALNPDDPLNPTWSQTDFRAHREQGLLLARRLKRELPDREIFIYNPGSGHEEVHLDGGTP